MSASESVDRFLRTSFRSLWALELLLHLRQTRERAWSAEELVRLLRGSELIVEQSLEGLMRAGLVAIDRDGCARFQPATAELETLIGEADDLYRRKPDMVRRIIVSGSHQGLATFADAFRLWKE